MPAPRKNVEGRAIGRERSADEILSDEIGKFWNDPLGYVMYVFPWDTESAIQLVKLPEKYRARFPGCEHGPDEWACDFLEEWGHEIRARDFDGHNPVGAIKFATVSGHEIGKSTMVAWIVKFILDTRPHSRGSITATTDEQLRTKTWAEVGKWHHLSLTEHWFDYNSSRGNMTLVAQSDPMWRADARTSRKGGSESFQGQHAPKGTSFYVFDEASGIEEQMVFDVREGGLTSGEPMVFDFGNGTRSSGAFYEECIGTRAGYIVRSIDSRDVAMTNKEAIATFLADRCGGDEDNDRFRVRVRGLFPATGTVQFIPAILATQAQEADDVEDSYHPLVLGVDVARKGMDSSVIYPRRGRDARSFEPTVVPSYDTVDLLREIVRVFNYFASLGTRPAMIFVDEGNTGGAVIDLLRNAGYPVHGVIFGATAHDKIRYRYRVDEIWGKTRDWLEAGGRLPARESVYGDRIWTDATSREFGYGKGGDQMRLETKDELRKRGLPSPDFWDALACTFALEMAHMPDDIPLANQGQTDYDYDPYGDISGGLG